MSSKEERFSSQIASNMQVMEIPLYLSLQGTILSCDHQMAYLYGYFSPDDLEGLKIKQLIPSLKLPVVGKPLEKVLHVDICSVYVL